MNIIMTGYMNTFISKYIIASKKDRLLYEYNTPKKRSDFMARFCHDVSKFIKPNSIAFYGKLEEALSKIDSNSSFLVFSELYMEGRQMDFTDLKAYLEKEYMEVIAIANSFAVLKEENEGHIFIYILR